MDKDQVLQIIQEHFDGNYGSGAPRIPPHTHNGVDNLQIDANTLRNYPVPSGAMLAYMGATIPTGWLLCDGSNVDRHTYGTLFTAIGTTYGVGNGKTTFTLPDLQRRIPMGSGGSGTAVIGNALSNTGGEETHTLTLAELASHHHTTIDGESTGAFTFNNGTAATANLAAVTGDNGGDQPHNNIQPAIIVNYIIKI